MNKYKYILVSALLLGASLWGYQYLINNKQQRKQTLKKTEKTVFTEVVKNRNIPIILVGNKTDLNNRREITPEEGLNFAKENNLLFKEISVKYELESTNVFNILSENIYEKIQNKELKIIPSNGIKLEHHVIDEDISKYKCCIIN